MLLEARGAALKCLILLKIATAAHRREAGDMAVHGGAGERVDIDRDRLAGMHSRRLWRVF